MTNETKILTGIGIITAVIIIVAAFTLGGKSGNASANNPKRIAEKQAKLLVHPDSHALGPNNAKVTIVEFGDFQCPACGAAYPIVKSIEKDYQGKIRIVFRNFPLTSVHANAQLAAEAAEAAGGQKKFWEMFDMLYSKQDEWGESKNPLDYFTKYATDLKLNVDQFKKDIADKKYDSKIQQDVNDANTLGIDATPTFFINKEMQSGILPYEEFKKKIDAILKNK